MFFINPFPQFSPFMVTVTQTQGLMAPNGQWIRVEHVKIHRDMIVFCDRPLFLCACVIKQTILKWIQNLLFILKRLLITGWQVLIVWKKKSIFGLYYLLTIFDSNMRRFTSTVPARGARAPNRAISNSCLWY